MIVSLCMCVRAFAVGGTPVSSPFQKKVSIWGKHPIRSLLAHDNGNNADTAERIHMAHWQYFFHFEGAKPGSLATSPQLRGLFPECTN
jgi:hypothetical protein